MATQSVLAEKESITSARLPSLDGWRAFSILLVLGAHCKVTAGFPKALDPVFNWIFDGDLGVRAFFLISGFLITWLLLVEQERTGKVNLGHFYARRALRILPVYFAFLGVLAALQYFTPYAQTSGEWFGNLTFTTNFLRNPKATSGHLWSLAVEEQFYLLWPGLFVAGSLARRLRSAWWLLGTTLLVAPFGRVVTYLSASSDPGYALFSPYSFLNYFDSLAMGCGCALLLSRQPEWLQTRVIARPRLLVVCALALVLIPHGLNRLFLLGFLTVPLGPTLQGAGMALILVQSLLRPHFGLYRWLNHPWVCGIGVLSYSLYIWQQLFSTKPAAFGLGEVWWLSFPGWLVPVFAVALVSYFGLERPLFRLRRRFRTADSGIVHGADGQSQGRPRSAGGPMR